MTDPLRGALTGRVALVTGAASNIGAASTRAIAAAGGRVLATDIDSAGLESTAAAIREAHGVDAVVTREADLEDPRAADSLVSAAIAAHGGVDVLVHAAVVQTRGLIEDITPGQWNQAFAVNVAAAAWMISAALPHLERDEGSVVLFSSVQARSGIPRCSLYGATKGAVEALTKHLAVELGPRGIRVNAISPAWVTDRPAPDPTELPAYPLGRFGRPDDIAATVVFLASPAASWMTGSVVAVDGGASAVFSGQASRSATQLRDPRWRKAARRIRNR